jgi:hypothetical protein
MPENSEQYVFPSSNPDDRGAFPKGKMSDEERRQLDVVDGELLADEAELLRDIGLDDEVADSLEIVRAMTKAKDSMSE